MALSKSQKMLRAKALGHAVKRLREYLDLSQENLVGEIRCGLDATMISRWERGFCSPNPAWRKRLAAFARRCGCIDVAAAFEEPLHEWKSVILTPEDRRLLALFEIVVLNKPADPEAWPPVLPSGTYERLVQALEDAADCLKKNQGRRFPPLPGRWGAALLTDEHVATWLRETDPRARKLTSAHMEDAGPLRSGDVVIHYLDGRVEIRKGENQKESTRGRTTR